MILLFIPEPSGTIYVIFAKKVFDRLRHANLKLKPSKCNFTCPQVKYLGHVVFPEGIAPDDDKISAVKDFPRPHNIKTVRSFLGLANYYRRFIKDFAKITSPLNQLLRKNHNFVWTNACEEAFKALKDTLISAPILAFPDFKEPFHLYTDASSEGIGVTLGQIQNSGEVAIAYAGRDFNAAEKNYSTTEREASAVIFGIKKFEPYLYGRKFILHTDHHSLKWLMTISDPSGRLARWSLLVQQYDFKIKHRPGVAHRNADAQLLSRHPYTPLPLTISAYDVPGVQIKQVRDFQRHDPDLADLIQYLESSKLPDKDTIAHSLTINDYFLNEDGLLFHLRTPKVRRRTTTHEQLVIPAALRYELLKWGHDDPTAAHLGTMKTYEKLHLQYYWRNMFSDIQHWCKSCCDCAMRKTPRNCHKAPLLPIPVQDAFDRVACDILDPFLLRILVTGMFSSLRNTSQSGLTDFPYLQLRLLELLAFSLKKFSHATVHCAPFCLTVGVTFWSRKFVGCLILQSLTLRHIIPPVMVKLSVSITPLLKPFLCLLIRNRLTGTCIYLLFFLLIGFRLVCLPVIVHSISFTAGIHSCLLTSLFCHQLPCLLWWRNIVRE